MIIESAGPDRFDVILRHALRVPFVERHSLSMNVAKSVAALLQWLNDGAFHYGYYDRKIPGLFFKDDTSVTKPFDLRGSGVLLKTGGFSGCDVTLSHPTTG